MNMPGGHPVVSTLRVSPSDFPPQELAPVRRVNGNGNCDREENADDSQGGSSCTSSGKSQPLHPARNSGLATTSVVHAIRGRVRLRVPVLNLRPQLVEPLQLFVLDQPGVTAVGINDRCSSVMVSYEPSTWSSDALCRLVKEFLCEELDAYGPARVALPGGSGTADGLEQLLSRGDAYLAAEEAVSVGGSFRQAYRIAGYISLVAGVILFIIPLVPGIPVLLLSGYCFTRAQ